MGGVDGSVGNMGGVDGSVGVSGITSIVAQTSITIVSQTSIAIGVAVVGIGVGISGSLADVVTIVAKMTGIAEMASVGKGNALGYGVKSLGDRVKTGAGTEGNSGGVAVGVAVVSIS